MITDAPSLDAAALSPDLRALDLIDRRLLWLASWTIHHANHLRESRDGLKVGGHQASCASMTTIMTALYFWALRAQDRVAVKPHASPVFHAAQHLFGRQSIEQLQRFRALGGAQAYPSRTKDKDDVDFSTGSVGLGVAVTAFASIVQDYLAARGRIASPGRFIALLGDAELDEGNVYEALIEGAKHDIRNCWWVVDYNRQSLDAVAPDRMFDRFDDFFAAAGWRVETLKHGALQRAAFQEPGGAALREWIEASPNDLYAALTFEGGGAWRERLDRDLSGAAREIVARRSDAELSALMTTLGGHCLETLIEAFGRAAATDRPTVFIAYTIKGFRLPFQGHKDNHSGLMTPTQIATLRADLGVPEGSEWDMLAGLSEEDVARVRAAVRQAPFASDAPRRFQAERIAVPPIETPTEPEISTQAAFGKIMNGFARSDSPLADALVTSSPDVTVSTNLGPWVNRRGRFAREGKDDLFRERRIASPQAWGAAPHGQHVELGIAEHNLFLTLAAFGLSAPLFGVRLIPIGTLYDPFVARGLDALTYASYQDSRFILVATPSGVTLGPEGGAHQSVSSPMIGMGQPGLVAYEPAFAEDLALLFGRALERVQDDDGESAYFRLSTRAIAQPKVSLRPAGWREDAAGGAYWLHPPAPGAEIAIAVMGALAPEAIAAHQALLEDAPGAGLLIVTSADLLHRDWRAAGAASLASRLLAPLAPDAGLVTLIDGAPATLSWLGSVRGCRVRALGVEAFGQSADLPDLYRLFGLDAEAIIDAAAALMLERVRA